MNSTDVFEVGLCGSIKNSIQCDKYEFWSS